MTGYSGTPLTKKLGLKDGHQCLFINVPSNYGDLLNDIPAIKRIEEPKKAQNIDFIHVFVTYEKELLDRWDLLRDSLNKSGMLWISWPKGSSKIPTDLNGNRVREIGLTGGLVDVKVCAVNEDWSGLKFVYRTKDR